MYLFRDYNGLDMYKDSLSTIYPLELCKLTLLAVDQWGDLGFIWEGRIKECADRFLRCHN